MKHGQVVEPAAPAKKQFTSKRIVFGGVFLILAFLAGFVPSYAKAQRQEKELREARQENRFGQLRDLAALAYLQASQKDYGLAAGTSTRFFDGTRQAANQTRDANRKRSLEELLSSRDPVTAKLATADSAVLPELQALLVRTRQATASSGAPQP
jgi:hypothetical protein